jgi:two-component system NtrC family sensor kinase
MKPLLKLLWIAGQPLEAETGIKILEESFLVDWTFASDKDSLRHGLQTREFDVIICACQSPGISGLEAFEILQKTDLKVPFIVLGKLSQKNLANECLRRGMCDFIFEEHLQTLGISVLRLIRQAEVQRRLQGRENQLLEDNRKAEQLLNYLKTLQQLPFIREVLGHLLDAVLLHLAADAGACFLAEKEQWVLGEARGLSNEFRRNQQAMDRKHPWLAELESSGEPAVVEGEKGSWPFLREETEIQSWAALVFGEKEAPVLLVVGSRLAGHFTKPLLSFLEELSRLTLGAIRNARLLEIVERGKTEWEKSLDALSDLIVIYDPDGRIRRVNQALRERLGLPYGAIMGKRCDELFGQGSLRLDFFPVSSIHSGVPFYRELDDPERGESYQVSCVPIHDQSGTLVGMIQIAKDITQEKKLREQLIQRETLSALGELVAGVAHELNNPLTGVIGYSQLMISRSDLDGSMKADLEKIANEGARAGKIVQSLLAFARQQRSTKVLASLPHLFDGTLDLFTYDLKHGSVTIIKQYDPLLQDIWADPGQIQQVFVNLISNALHAMDGIERPPILTIKIWQDRDWQYFQLRDNGCGIPRSDLSRVFDPFFTTKPVGKGTGLGLSISFGLVSEHGGEITVESEEGEGAEFRIRFPLKPPIHEELLQRSSTLASTQQTPRKILVVDDDPIILNLIKQILEYEGHTVHQATTGKAGLESIAREEYDVVVFETSLSDLKMEELFGTLRDQYPQTLPQLLFLTAELIKPEVRLFLAQTGRPVLAKPFSIPELSLAIANIPPRR